MAKNNEDKKTALKLVNKYAESYNILEEENKSLRSEVKDLRANLKINKEIIEGFFNFQNKNDKNSMYINKLKEENLKMTIQIEKTINERDDLRRRVRIINKYFKLNYLEQTTSDILSKEREESEKNKYKLFIIENAIIKRDNVILALKHKLQKYSEEDKYYVPENEIIVIEPTLAINQLHDELYLYKEIYENLSTQIRESKESSTKYESLVTDLQNEISKLKAKNKIQSLSANREKENIKNTRSTSNDTDLNQISKKLTVSYLPNEIHIPVDLNKLRNKLKVSEEVLNNYAQGNFKSSNFSNNEEWLDILKMSGITPEELDKFAKNKMLYKIVEAIEMLNRLVCDKNLQIRLLEEENTNLNQKNFSLNKENIQIFQQTLDLKKELQKYVKIKKLKNLNLDLSESSMVNNTSRISVNNIKINKINKNLNDKTSLSDNNKNFKRNLKNLPGITHLKKNNKSDIKTKIKKDSMDNYKDIVFNNLYREFGVFVDANSFAQDESEHSQSFNNTENNETVEYFQKNENSSESKNTVISVNQSDEESSLNDSIVYTKEIKNQTNLDNNLNSVKKNNLREVINNNQNNPQNKDMNYNTLDSCTSTEFRDGLKMMESFISQGNNDIENLKIEIKNTNI